MFLDLTFHRASCGTKNTPSASYSEGAKTGAAVKIIKLLALSRAAPLAVTTVEPQAATTEATTAVAATTMMT